MELQLFFIFAFVLLVRGQISNDLDIDVNDLKQRVGQETGFDLGQIDESKIPQADEIDLMFRNKCDTKSGNGTYDTVKEAKDVFQECISQFVNVTVLKQEVEESKKTGSMDEVFGKYCDKFPEISNCTYDFLEALEPCLEENERTSLNISLGISQKLKDFACFKKGDRIAMFVAEGGVECITSQKEALQNCFNSTLSSRVPADMTPNTLPVLMFNDQDCQDFAKLRLCISDALSHCKQTTPGNLIDAFFKYAKKVLPCSLDAAEQNLGKGSFAFSPVASLSLVTILTISITLL